ncbi:cyclic nucleotide-binding domain-containing protein [Anoxynatronum buryatiense]|uniref:cAMP-binding domain of CRP or a regulatory subunit of cAMP-dependent protein kinases n=1 Tax=Anoxynatronum buryatiense TaxID=489973 RepID=A0AA46AJD3_9CLOT|nr:cyclic nucleotide-binding domain-containing protein [Anoxynatronum buryatiense]SMP60224.1 cAMP-binding domain of CRP or a regulatory subunit of cAMP-dependent protein kinases [Anoxynatronum buryatiense]
MKNFTLDEAESELGFDATPHMRLFWSISEYVQVNVFENKDHIIYANRLVPRLYLLMKGKAKISVTHEDGGSSIVYFVKPNELIGELSLIDIEDRPKDVISIGTSLCLSVPMDVAKSTLIKDAQFMLDMSRYIGTKLIERTWFNAKQQHYELKYRLAAYILLCECDGIYNEKHTQSAEYLAVSYRHFLHTLSQMKAEGLIKKEKKGFAFDREALEALAEVMS